MTLTIVHSMHMVTIGSLMSVPCVRAAVHVQAALSAYTSSSV